MRYIVPMTADDNICRKVRIVIGNRPLCIACDGIGVGVLCRRFHCIPHGIVGVIAYFLRKHLQHSVITRSAVAVDAVFLIRKHLIRMANKEIRNRIMRIVNVLCLRRFYAVIACLPDFLCVW